MIEERHFIMCFRLFRVEDYRYLFLDDTIEGGFAVAGSHLRQFSDHFAGQISS